MRFAIVLAFLATGCVGTLGDAPARPGGPGPIDPVDPIDPTPEPVRVSLAGAPLLEPSGACASLGAGESVLDVSPEGDAWIASDSGLRVLARDGSEWALPYPPAARPSYLVAHDARTATWIANGLVERAIPGGLRRAHVPAESGTPRWLCGDPEASGPFVVATELGLHAREGGQFWRYTAEGSSLLPSHPFALASGACSGASGELWFSDEDGAWRLEVASGSPSLHALDAIPAGLAIVRDGSLAAAIGEGVLFVIDGSDALEIELEEGAPRAVSVGGGRVWVAAGATIGVRDAAGAWSRVDASADDLFADATGAAWARSASELCRLELGASLAIAGLAPDERVAGARTLTITASAMADSAEVSIDGAVVFETDAASTRIEAGELPMGAPGWHELVATARIEGTEVRRAIAYEVIDTAPISYERDVQPFVETHCVGCHSEGTTTGVRLDSYDAFRARAPSALARIVRREMPPSPLDPAPAEMVRTVERWVEGGMMP